MKRILGVGLALVLAAFAAMASVPAADADDDDYEALIRYFHGQISRGELDEALRPPIDPDSIVPAVTTDAALRVSNDGQSDDAATWHDRDRGQIFTTGSLSGTGAVWQITSVTLEFDFTGTPTEPTYELKLRAVSGNQPTGATLGTFSPSSGALAAGVNTFTLDGTTPLDLQPNTQYALIFDVSVLGSGSGEDIKFQHTNSDNEDSGAAAGWSIANGSLNRVIGQTGNFGTFGDALKISISAGTYTPPGPPPPPPPSFTQTLGQLGNDYSWASLCGGTPNPREEAFRRDPLGTRWDPYETVYCNETTGEWVTGRIPQPGVDFAWDHQLIAPGAPGYDESCYFTNADGDRTPLAKSVTNPDGSWARNSDGSRIFTFIHGAHWDPIANRCVQR